jgi:F0F1-type ATP synthase membrane subunit b/b'
MSEALWGQIITGLITVLLAGIAAWKAAKTGAEDAVKPVSDKVEHSIEQNKDIIAQGESTHRQFNSRFDQWKRETEEANAAAMRAMLATIEEKVLAAKAEGERIGAEKERRIAEEKAKAVLATEKDSEEKEKKNG